jgi:hypothetical protein
MAAADDERLARPIDLSGSHVRDAYQLERRWRRPTRAETLAKTITIATATASYAQM